MRKSAVVIPIMALVAGAFGFMVRQMEINTVFDSVTGFANRNSQVTFILICLSAAAIILAVAFGIYASYKYTAENSYARAFAPDGLLYMGVSFVLGLTWLVADVLYYVYLKGIGPVSVVDIIFIALSGLSAVSVLLMARGAYKGQNSPEMLLFGIIPPLFFSFWLIILYKNNAANPVLLSYCYQSLAIAAAALSFYFSAGFVFGKMVIARMTFSYLVTIYFGTVVLADNVGLPIKIIFGVAVAVAFINAVVFLRNLQHK